MPDTNRRESERNYSYAKVVFHDHNVLGYIRDISVNGIRAEVLSDEEEQPRKGVALTIIPDPELKMPPFNVRAAVRWSKSNGPTVSVGLQVEKFSSGKGKRVFGRLRSLLAAASA